jgi:hypothetical protein
MVESSEKRGPGRPPIGDETGAEKKIRLAPSEWRQLKEISGGSYAQGVRDLLKNYFKRGNGKQ